MDVEVKKGKIKKIRAGKEFVLAFARRIVMVFPRERRHLTFEFHPQKNRLNIHETFETCALHRGIVDMELNSIAQEAESWLQPLVERLLHRAALEMASAYYRSRVVAVSHVPGEAWLVQKAQELHAGRLALRGILRQDLMPVTELGELPAGNYLAWRWDNKRHLLVFGGLILWESTGSGGRVLYIDERFLRRLELHSLARLWRALSFPEEADERLKARFQEKVRRAISSLRSSRKVVELARKGGVV